MKELLAKIQNLPIELKEIYDKIYEIKIFDDKMKIPEQLKEHFAEASEQEIIVITNKILHQETAFNLWRNKRDEPVVDGTPSGELLKNEFTPSEASSLALSEAKCPFCNPREMTPEDEIGRLENEGAITGSNIADSSKYHSLVIFKKHNFSDLDKNDIVKAFELAKLWFQEIIIFDEKLKYGFLIWNQGYRAAASISHPHLQIFATETLPEKFEFIKDNISNYQQKYNSNYYDDLFLLHNYLGLAKKFGEIKIIISLTPLKDKEIVILMQQNEFDIKNLNNVIDAYKKFSESFNLFLLKEPYGGLPSGFIVDRGDPDKKNSDMGSLELYAFSVVGFDLENFAKKFLGSL